MMTQWEASPHKELFLEATDLLKSRLKALSVVMGIGTPDDGRSLGDFPEAVGMETLNPVMYLRLKAQQLTRQIPINQRTLLWVSSVCL